MEPIVLVDGDDSVDEDQPVLHVIDDSIEMSSLPDLGEAFSVSQQPCTVPAQGGPATTDNSIQSMNNENQSEKPAKPRRKPRSAHAPLQELHSSQEESPDLHASQQAVKSFDEPQISQTTNTVSQKQMNAAIRQAEREAKRAEKERLKAAKQRERELLALNKTRRSRKECTKEMIVDVSRDFLDSAAGRLLTIRLAEMDTEICACESCPFANTITWKRKRDSFLDSDLGMFVPCPSYIEEERFVLIYERAEDFMKLVGPSDVLDQYMSRRLSVYSGFKVLVVLEGAGKYFRQKKAAFNREYANAFRNGSDSAESRERLRTISERDAPSEDDFEETLLDLQMRYGCFVSQSSGPEQSAETISNYNSEIAYRLYKTVYMQEQSANFCGESGQIKTGLNAFDSYQRMLQEIHSVTPHVAASIAQVYPTLPSLLSVLRDKGADALTTVRVGTTYNTRNIGPMLSRKIHHILLCSDPQADAFG